MNKNHHVIPAKAPMSSSGLTRGSRFPIKSGMTIIIGLILLFTFRQSFSQSNLPYPTVGPQNGIPECHQTFINRMAEMRTAWKVNLETLASQEKPASEMVDEAFEGVRTYRCWLEYLCRSVLYSGPADPAASAGSGRPGDPSGLTEDHIGQVPGCAAPEDITIPGAPGPAFPFIPQCHVKEGPARTTEPSENFNACKQYLELNFGSPATDAAKVRLEKLKTTSNVYITLEKQLKQVHADQRASAVEDKLRVILNKMHNMEVYAQTLKTLFFKLDALLPCYAAPCT